MRYLITFLSITITTGIANAQDVGSHEISIAAGYGTSDQYFDGVTPIFMQGATNKYTNSFASGAWFLNYKGYISPEVTVGFTASFEQEKGDWGVPMDESSDKYPLGVFNRVAYTLAPEVSVKYREDNGARIYATFGIGLTTEKEKDIFQAAYYANAISHYNYTGTLTGTETTIANNRVHLNGYFSPFGFRFGNKLGGYFELGIGYKGIINGGISYRFGKAYQPNTAHEVFNAILLPHNFPLNNNFSDAWHIGDSKTEKFKSFGEASTKLKRKASRHDANAIRIDELLDTNDGTYYRLNGTAFAVNDIQALQKALYDFRVLKGDSANLVIYRPSKGHVADARIYINDSSEIELHAHEKYVYPIKQEGSYKIAGTDGDTVRLNIKFGHNYYLKVFYTTDKPKVRDLILARRDGRDPRLTHVVVIMEEKGELESSIIKKVNSAGMKKGRNGKKETAKRGKGRI
jgi:hypothetical protein